MRLIDADKLIEDRVENDPVRIAAECAETAYDVEKIIEQLDQMYDVAREQFKKGYGTYYDGARNAYQAAIHLVERGGDANE